MIILDIWGEEGHLTLVARYVVGVDAAMEMAKRELVDGYLVNMRLEMINHHKFENFDARKKRTH